jgi:lysophospholipase L1-like esterase
MDWETAMRIRSGAMILFQGDSITDADRNRWKTDDLGTGYVRMLAERFLANHPELRVRFLNRGISGTRIRDLRTRWQMDCLDLNPDVVSILIGVNDTLGPFFWGEPTSLESFEEDFTSILDLACKNLNAQIILLEPFLLPLSEDQFVLRPDLDARIKVVGKLAEEFSTDLVHLDSVFSDAAKLKAPEYWLTDGVHPTPAGHALIADSWLRIVEFV